MKTTHTLTLIAFGSALLAAGCFGGAYTLANAKDNTSATTITRELAWDGSATLTLGVPSVVRYVQAPGPGKVVARGPERSVSTLIVSGGHIHDQLLRTGAVLDITVTAPGVRHFYLNGRSRLSIENYDQDRLSVRTEGSAAVDVTGRTTEVTVVMEGAGAINLARLDVQTLNGTVAGAGTLIAAPTGTTTLDMRNFSSAVLLTKPADLRTKLSDSGRVIDAAVRK